MGLYQVLAGLKTQDTKAVPSHPRTLKYLALADDVPSIGGRCRQAEGLRHLRIPKRELNGNAHPLKSM